jgi:hypothetical protein
MLTLTKEQVTRLEAILAELPMKYGVPILNILNENNGADNHSESADKDTSIQPD